MPWKNRGYGPESSTRMGLKPRVFKQEANETKLHLGYFPLVCSISRAAPAALQRAQGPCGKPRQEKARSPSSWAPRSCLALDHSEHYAPLPDHL